MQWKIRAVTEEQIADAVQWYDDGQTVSQIAEKVGVSRTTVWRHISPFVMFKRKGVDTAVEVSERHAEIRAAYEGGASMAKVGKKFGISRQRVYQILVKTGRNR
jgi:DNA invertase Pin-like site-specific DNA recombinase